MEDMPVPQSSHRPLCRPTNRALQKTSVLSRLVAGSLSQFTCGLAGDWRVSCWRLTLHLSMLFQESNVAFFNHQE